jgi:hypothetical protein
MKNLICYGAICLASILLAACDKKPEVHSVEYYKQNGPERAQMLDKCKSDADLTIKDANCTNAASAEFRSGSFKPSTPKSW